MKNRSIIIAIILLAAALFFLLKFLSFPSKHVHKFRPMGGIPCRLVIYDISKKSFGQISTLIEERVDNLENVFSRYRSDSEVSKINKAESKTWIGVSGKMAELLNRAKFWGFKSGQKFQITVGPLIELWKESEKRGRLPSEGEISQALKKSSYLNLRLSEDKQVYKTEKDMILDLGGIAKGYLLDDVGAFLQELGVVNYIFSCGGDVVMQGKESFSVGVQSPIGKDGDLMMILDIPAGAVVTSGHYERYVTINGKHYSHIIDPQTGYPVDEDVLSVTVFADNAVDADALATTLIFYGNDRKSIEQLLAGQKEAYAILVLKDGDSQKILYSKGLENKIEFKGKWESVPIEQL